MQSGKEGTLYALKIANLGKYNPNNNNGNAYQVIPKVFGASSSHQLESNLVTLVRQVFVIQTRMRWECSMTVGGIYGSLSYFPAAKALFGHGLNDVIRRVNLSNNKFAPSSVKGTVTTGFPPTTPVISAVDTTSTGGLVYEASSANGLVIYDSTTLTTVFKSLAADRMNCGLTPASPQPSKFQVPLVANGNVFYGCDGAVLKYGL